MPKPGTYKKLKHELGQLIFWAIVFGIVLAALALFA